MNSFQSQKRPRRGLPLKAASALILLCAGWFAAHAQTAAEPRREQLLNGLRILMLSRPGDGDVLIKLRVHSGAAFDLAGKEGLMATLADAMFDQQTRDYVTEELDGRIEVVTDYDSINITLAGRATDFDRLLELARNAVTNPQLTPEAIERARAVRLKALGAKASAPAEQADRAVAARLFGTYPYGRAAGGSTESIARIERADILLMRERFLYSDTTTLVIVGGFDPKRVMRSLRSSLGGWRKSDGKIPSTFRLPDPPDERTLVINNPGSSETEVRLSLRGLARTDRDAPAAQLLASVVRERWLSGLPELKDRVAFVRHDAYRNGGVFRLGASMRSPTEAAKALELARAILRDLASNAPTAAEIERARRMLQFTAQNIGALTDSWLDEHSYNSKAATAPEIDHIASSLTPSETQRVAARLFLHTPSATVAIGDAAQLRTELARIGAVEIFGEAAAKPEATPPPKPQQPAIQLKRP
ncbi:MAG: insulinase family protein [Rubrivivax sp.]|nr:insulinase family protein [Pyrinomonadaceae bacterium]